MQINHPLAPHTSAPGGDSAGANLLLSALAHARDTGRLRTPPAGLCLISPCVDMTSESVFSRKDIGSVGQHDYLPKEKLNEGLPCCYTPVRAAAAVARGRAV